MPSERGSAAAVPATTITALLLDQARRSPEAVAVRQWDRELTYAELVGRAAGLAAVLRDRGVRPEVLVGICVRRTPDLVVAVLGVLLAGGAYVPVDPDQPAARVRGLLDDAGARLVVGDAEAATHTDRPAVPVPAEGDAGDVTVVDAGPAQPGNAAYVMYTSGSTGRPKGVLVTHHSVVAWVTAFGSLTGADARTRSFGFATLGFDASVADLFVPLAAGGSVALLTEADRADPARLQRFVEHHGVTWGFLTPALLPLLDPERLPAWSCLAVGGETVWAGEVERWTGDAAVPRRFIHSYGPTETTVIVLAAEVAGRCEGPLPLGTPVGDHRVAVVDADLRPVPAGVPGELLIGGTGVARGYLGDPALTAERFVPDPDVPGARLYRTGDLVVRDEHGTLTYLRRLDRQVQLRGQRTEPGEVEAVLRTYPRLEQVAVEPVDGPAGVELVAFVAAPADVTDEALRHWCGERLPRHMVPRVVRVATLPLGPTGKVDTVALRELALPSDRDVPRPIDPVGAAWCDALGLASAHPDDDFFASGGHSVAAMRLVAALRAGTGRDVAIEDVFQARTLGRLTARVHGAAELAEDLPTGSAPALSPPQLRLWFLDQLAPESTAYHVALVQRLRGPLDQAALRAALAAVAAKHDVLRWRFPTAGGVPTVVVDPITEPPLPVTDLTRLPDGERDAALQAELHAHAGTRIDLARGPLWSARLFRTGADEHVLGLVVHHAVFDGWSQAPLFRDLGAAYAGGPAALPPAPAGFADYVAWRADRDRRRSADDLRWWAAHLAGAPTVLRIPHDRPRPPVQTYRGATVHGELDAATSAAVAGLADRLATPPSTVLLAAFAELLRRVTGGTDVVIGTPAADRRHLAFGELVGFFVEVLPLRLRVDAGAPFADLVRACGDEVLDVLAHPAAPLERIVDALRVPRDPATAPLVQVLFNVYNFPEPQLRLDGLECSPLQPTLPGSPFDLTTYVVRRGPTFAVDVLYNPDLFDAPRIEALLAGYRGMVADLVAAPDTPVRAARLPGSAVLASGLVAPPVRPAAPPGGSPATAATTPTERAIAGVWREVLGRADIDATHNFFDVGGTSLAMTGVRARLHAVLGRDLRMVELFQHPSIRELAAYVDGATGAPEIDEVARRVAARRGRAHRAAARRAVRRQHTDEPGGRA